MVTRFGKAMNDLILVDRLQQAVFADAVKPGWFATSSLLCAI